MNLTDPNIAEQLATVAKSLQTERTGHAPGDVKVVLSENMLVVILQDALTVAEQRLSQDSKGADHVQRFHRELFATSTKEMNLEIRRITGRDVREQAAEIETQSGTAVHALTGGAMVQVYWLSSQHAQATEPATSLERESINRAEDDGLRFVPPEQI